MNRAGRLIGASVVAALVGATLAPVPAARGAAIPKEALYVPGEVVVVFRDRGRTTTSLAQARALARRVGARVSRLSSRGRTAVIRGGASADVRALARRFAADPNVRFAEPNYIYRATGATAGVSSITAPSPFIVRKAPGTAGKVAVPKAALRAMKSRTKAGIKATYPSDKLLWDNAGWDWVGASIVWNNTTASRNVCVVDTGVDYQHQDLGPRVVKGWDFVNEDADPMDDNGHGTHLAGIIAAKHNNTMGIAGVSPTAKVVAMKALNAEGWGTNFDIRQAIDKCASRTDVSIINLSIGGPYSELQRLAIVNATLAKGKLVVASAGNESSDMPYCLENTETAELTDTLYAGVRSYPAGFVKQSWKYTWDGNTCVEDTANELHPAYPGMLSVAAGGYDLDFNYECRAGYSNFGDWVNVTAPGTDILSTTPWDKPFTMNTDEGCATRYDYVSGTSMAAAFASGVAARAWGFLAVSQPNVTNAGVVQWVTESGWPITTEDDCWPAGMAGLGVTDVNVAAALNRGALQARAFDAVTGLPLVNATIQAFQGTTAKATAVVTATTTTSVDYPDGYLSFPSLVDLINLPAEELIIPKVNKSGYTSTATNAFMGGEGNADGTIEVPRGWWGYAGYAAVPPKSPRFSIVSAWDEQDRQPPLLTTQLPAGNLAGDFMVGWDVCGDTTLEGDAAGELSAFPFAQELYPYVHTDSQGFWIGNLWDTHQIVQRTGAVALPYYPGSYVVRVYNEAKDFDTRLGSVFVWKDGGLKQRVDMTGAGCSDVASDNDWWEVVTVTSGTGGSVSFTPVNECHPSGSLTIPLPAACNQ